MKTLSKGRQVVHERGCETSTDSSFTSRFVTRNLRTLNAALKTARTSLNRGKNVAIRTRAEFHRAISAKRDAQ